MKWRMVAILAAIFLWAVLYGYTRNQMVALAFLAICGGFVWQRHQQKVTSKDDDGDERILWDVAKFFICCLVAFISGTVWGVVHDKGWGSVLFGLGNFALFFVGAMVVSLQNTKAT